MNDNKVKVIVFGNADFAQYIQKQTKDWYVQPPTKDIREFWDRIDFFDEDPSHKMALDPSSLVVIFQDVYNGDYDELDDITVGTISSFVRAEHGTIFLFGDDKFYTTVVDKVKSYEYEVQKDEGEQNPVYPESVPVILLPNSDPSHMIPVLKKGTSHIINWGGKPEKSAPQETQPPTAGEETEPSSRTPVSTPGNVDTSSVVDTGSMKPLGAQEPKPTQANYAEETVSVATQNYNKPEGAIPDQLTIAVMSSKGGSGKCLRGDQLVVDATSGRFVPIRDVVSGTDPFRVVSFNGEKVSAESVGSKFVSGVKETFTVELSSGRKVSATANHPFLTAGGWKNLEELELGETVASPRRLPFPTDVTNVGRTHIVHKFHNLTHSPDASPHGSDENGNELLQFATLPRGGKRFKNVPLLRKFSSRQFSRKGSLVTQTHTLRAIPDEVFSYDRESLLVFLGEFWETFHVPSYTPQEGEREVRVFVSHDNPMVVKFHTSQVNAEKLRGLFLRLSVSMVDRVAPKLVNVTQAGEQLDENVDGVYEYVWGVADFCMQNFLNITPLSPEIFETYTAFRKSLTGNKSEEPSTHPTCDTPTLASMKKIFQTNQTVDDISLSAMNEVLFYTKPNHYAEGVKEEGFIAVNTEMGSAANIVEQEEHTVTVGGLNELRYINLDVLKSWGVPSGNAVGDHYGWLISEDIFWDPIVSVTSEGMHEVYDIEVPSVHNFIANNVVVHNSTTALMLASAIAKSTRAAGNPKKVVLVDLDTRDGQVGSLIGQYLPTSINIRMVPPRQRTATVIQKNLVHDKKLEIDALLAPVRPSHADDVGPEFYEQVIGILQTTHDVVIIDCSVNYLDSLLGSAFKVSDTILLVTTLAVTSIQGMTRALHEMKASKENGGLGIPKEKIKIVINQVVDDVAMPREKVIKAILGIEIVGKIPSLPRTVLTYTNQTQMYKLFGNSKLSASYIILANNCLRARPKWKMKAPSNIRNFRAIQTLIQKGRLE